jgi:cytochrome P450
MTTINGSVLAELALDPYPRYARLRREAPVSRIAELDQWLVTTFREAHTVLTDTTAFTTAIPDSPMIRYCGGTPLLLREGAAHQDVRSAFEHDYDPHRVADYVDAIVRPEAERRLERLAPAHRAELVADYFEPVAAAAEATLLGLGPTGADTLRRWGRALAAAATNFAHDPAVDHHAVAELADDADVVRDIAAARADPDFSVIAHLLYSDRPAGRPDADVLPVLKHVAMSVIEPGWLAGWTLLALWDHPDQLAEVRGRRWLLGAAVYEALRWSGPVGTLTRRTTRPVALGGTQLPAGATVLVAIASANRDESVFADADSFDLHRTVRTNLGLGAGSHRCPAFAFAPVLARTALDVLFDRLPELRPAPDARRAPHGWKLRLPGPVEVCW